MFGSPNTIIKLGPPHWSGEMAREVAALEFVAGKLPMATPPLIGHGTIDHWDYIVQARLPGTPLWELWPNLPLEAKADLAYQHGQLMSTIHTLSLQDSPADLQFDWRGMMGEQTEQCAGRMENAGVATGLVAQVDAYLTATAWSLEAGSDVLLHGDLNHLNFLVSEREDGRRLTGVYDWGDAKIGPVAHELISPGAHMYKGNAALLAQWYDGYQLAPEKRTEAYAQVVMARAMLYYAGGFPHLLKTVEGAAACHDWGSVAHCFWRLA